MRGDRSDYRKRVSQGRCGACGRTPEPGKKCCRKCLDAAKEKSKRHRSRHTAKGLCRCGGEPIPGTRGCVRCKESNAEGACRRLEQAKRDGLCLCGAAPRPGRKTCERCGRYKSRKACEKVKRRAESGLCRRCGKQPAPGKSCCEPCLKYANNFCKVSRDAKRLEILAKYGNACACCGERAQQFLTFDHVNNDGSAHRKEIGNGTDRLMRWIEANDYPDSIQLLCWNCNLAKAHHGVCPHEEARRATQQP